MNTHSFYGERVVWVWIFLLAVIVSGYQVASAFKGAPNSAKAWSPLEWEPRVGRGTSPETSSFFDGQYISELLVDALIQV